MAPDEHGESEGDEVIWGIAGAIVICTGIGLIGFTVWAFKKLARM